MSSNSTSQTSRQQRSSLTSNLLKDQFNQLLMANYKQNESSTSRISKQGQQAQQQSQARQQYENTSHLQLGRVGTSIQIDTSQRPTENETAKVCQTSKNAQQSSQNYSWAVQQQQISQKQQPRSTTAASLKNFQNSRTHSSEFASTKHSQVTPTHATTKDMSSQGITQKVIRQQIPNTGKPVVGSFSIQTAFAQQANNNYKSQTRNSQISKTQNRTSSTGLQTQKSNSQKSLKSNEKIQANLNHNGSGTKLSSRGSAKHQVQKSSHLGTSSNTGGQSQLKMSDSQTQIHSARMCQKSQSVSAVGSVKKQVTHAASEQVQKNLQIQIPISEPLDVSNQAAQVMTTKNSYKVPQFQSLSTRNSNPVDQQASNASVEVAAPLQPGHKIIIPNHEATKCSMKRNGAVRAYAANTNQGLVRNYNEDRVSIILNILKPPSRSNENWPKCSFFGIYDGHGGAACADFLRDNLHQFVIKESSFPWNPKEALKNGFKAAEVKFMELCQVGGELVEKSGSCAIVVLIVADLCYIANVGDSRALLSGEGGKRIFPLSRDHKPTDDLEKKRIVEAGGQIYQQVYKNYDISRTAVTPTNVPGKKEVVVGPLRVLPGRLSVSRTFGDAEAKLEATGGNPNVVIPTPEIKSFKITKDHDFIIMGSDGIFDKLSNKETVQCCWNSVKDGLASSVHKQCGLSVEYVLKNSLVRRTFDNVTVVMVAFSNFKTKAFGKREQEENKISQIVHQQRPSSTRNQQIGKINNENHPPEGAAQTAKLSHSPRQQPFTTTNHKLQQKSVSVAKSSHASGAQNAAKKHFDFQFVNH